MLKRNPVQCEDLFLTREPRKLTALQIYDLFSPNFSPQGSNARDKELQVMVYWMDFLENCEGAYSRYICMYACSYRSHGLLDRFS